MDRRNWYFAQTVTDGELEGSQDAVEETTRQLQADMSFEGIAQGLVATEAGTPDLTVEVSAGVAYNSLGERCHHPTAVIVDVSEDYLGNPTAITQGAGYEAILGVSIGFAREFSDDRIDGNDNPLFFLEEEVAQYRVTKGSETNTPPAVSPPLEAGFVRVCDIRLVHGASAITDAFITPPGGTYTGIDNARQDMFLATAGTLEVRANNAEAALQQLLTLLDDHPASEIAVDASSDWHDGTANPADDLQARLDKMIDDLAGETTGDLTAGGAFMVGHTDLTAWKNGKGRPAQSVGLTLEAIANDLGAENVGEDGMKSIGGEARTGAPAGALTAPAGSAASQMQYLLDNLPQLGVTANQAWVGPHEFDAAVKLDGTVDVRSAAVVTSAGSLTINTGAPLTLQSGSPATISRILTMSGADAGIQYRTGTLGNADANLDVGTDEYRFTAIPLTDRTFTLLDSTGNTPVNGQRIKVIATISGGVADAIFVRETGGTELGRIKAAPAGNIGTIEFTYHSAGNGWYVSGVSGDGVITPHT